MLPAWEKKREEERQTVKKTIAKIYYFWKIPTQKKIDRESNELFFIIIDKVNKTEIVFLLFLFLKISAAAMAKMRSFGQEKFKSEFWRSQQHFSPFWLLPSLCFIFFRGFVCVYFFYLIELWEHHFYSSLSSTGIGAPPLADADDDDRIGPDNFNMDVKAPPEPPADTPTLSSPPDMSAFTSSSTLAPAPPLKPPELPPKVPLNPPLSAPNFVLIAAIFGAITAWSNADKLLIGTGGSMP